MLFVDPNILISLHLKNQGGEVQVWCENCFRLRWSYLPEQARRYFRDVSIEMPVCGCCGFYPTTPTTEVQQLTFAVAETSSQAAVAPHVVVAAQNGEDKTTTWQVLGLHQTHQCLAECGTVCPPHLLMCKSCWRKVPRTIGLRVVATYRRRTGEMDSSNPTWQRWAAAAHQAVMAVNPAAVHTITMLARLKGEH